MASWDTPAVAAPSTASYAAPLVNFDELGKLPETYLKMKEMKRQDDVANACRNGIPRVDPNNPNSTPDYIAMSETMLKLGNYPEATTLQNTGIQMQQLRNAQRIADQYFSPLASAGSGQPSTAASATGSPARTQPTTSPSTSSAAQPKTVMTIMAAQGTPNDQLQAVSDSVARQLGVGPNDPIGTSDPRVRNVLAGAIKQFRNIGQPVPAQSDATADAQATPAQRISQGFSDAIPSHGVPDGAQTSALPAKVAAVAQSQLDAMSTAERKATLSNWVTNPAFEIAQRICRKAP
jgi:hypothetical protein